MTPEAATATKPKPGDVQPEAKPNDTAEDEGPDFPILSTSVWGPNGDEVLMLYIEEIAKPKYDAARRRMKPTGPVRTPEEQERHEDQLIAGCLGWY